MKRFLILILCVALLTGLTPACGGIRQTGSQTAENTNTPGAAGGVSESAPAETQAAEINSNMFTTLYSSEYSSLNYLVSSDTPNLKAVANIIDGLTEYDAYGAVLPALAESWSSGDDNTVWTFKIRQGVKWVDKTGREAADITAQDWVDAARYVNDAHNRSALQYAYEGVVKNASEYFSQTSDIMRAENAVADGKAESVDAYYADNYIDPSNFITFEDVGVKAIDKYTLEYTLTAPMPYFISLLSYASYLPVYGPLLEERGGSFGSGNDGLLFNGAYILSEFKPNEKHVFTSNPLYWDRGKVYIPEYQEIYNDEESTLAPEMFKRGEVGEAKIGTDILDKWFTDSGTKDLVRSNMPDVQYSYFYVFNFEPRFDARYEPENWLKAVNNENFRLALQCGLDRVSALAVSEP